MQLWVRSSDEEFDKSAMYVNYYYAFNQDPVHPTLSDLPKLNTNGFTNRRLQMSVDNLRILEIDITGQICPSSLLVALREINKHFAELSSGQLHLLFRTDNRQAVNTIPESAANMGLSCSVEKTTNGYILAISK